MRVQYCSDLHLEFYNDNVNKVKRLFDVGAKRNKDGKGDILLLAGDIGKPTHASYKTFIDMVSHEYKKVFVIAGNHEYYKMNMSVSEVDDICRDICHRAPCGNVTFLQNEMCRIEGCCGIDESTPLFIHGGTMWSYIPRPYHRIIESSIRDYDFIQGFTPVVSNQLHQEAVAALEQNVTKVKAIPGAKLLVMSHHMPGFQFIDPKYTKTPDMMKYNYAFASDIKCAEDDCISHWIYGHTHSPLVSGKFHCNPVGYPGENMQWSLGAYFDM
jgi:DNA repair exonuclease SbcCD nuclease subunit